MEPLREELTLTRQNVMNGYPVWVLHDPTRNRYTQIDWRDMIMLRYWHLRDPKDIVQAAQRETTAHITEDDVLALYGFLKSAGLLICVSPDDTKRMTRVVSGHGWLTWLIHNYLFMRFKTGNPDKHLTAIERRLPWVFTKGFLVFLIVLILYDALEITGNWSSYASGFQSILTPSGLFMGMVAIYVSKLCHEYGHGLMAKHFGCRVSSWGVALVVMAPVLWTDTTDAWLLDHKKRLWIDCAGMLAEICLAAFASALWIMTPDGDFRHFLFILSSTTWIMALAINLSPLMRFDGYHILSDALQIPNLMERGFAYTRWFFRAHVLGLTEDKPEEFSPKIRCIILAYAVATWIYRFGLFMGIALMVYHAVFHALGVILMGIEIGCFIIMPVIKEIMVSYSKMRKTGITRKAAFVGLCLLALFVYGMIPRTSLITQGLWRPEQQYKILAPAGVSTLYPKAGECVSKGQALLKMDDTEKRYALQAAIDHEYVTHAVLDSIVDDSTGQDYQDALSQEVSSVAHIHQAQQDLDKLTVYAPFSGCVTGVNPQYHVSTAIGKDVPVGYLVTPSASMVETYVDEGDVAHIRIGDAAKYRVYGELHTHDMIVQSIAQGGTHNLEDPEFSSLYHGTIASHKDKESLVPDNAVYRVTLSPKDTATHTTYLKSSGNVTLTIHGDSIIMRFLRHAASVFIRESDI